jgi:hypothetical protein
MERVAQRLDAIVEVCGRVTAWSSLAIVLVMAFNVLLRYAFNPDRLRCRSWNGT